MIGSVEDVARICGTDRKAGYHWRHASQTRSAGDFPSARHLRFLLGHAAKIGAPLTADHLVWGATEVEINALMAKWHKQRAAQVAAQ
ncbi:hypothetical protein [Pacificibacter marinus]|uniref:hypothetical protein n=1 Tax=Pacificibacter marinus TaxID=658057 RepID=UPI001C075E4B|nr:hypothetical protein [Pacificibacter marinus]MBU2867036.1 hypothetical protein [Pacificibacter marinus]